MQWSNLLSIHLLQIYNDLTEACIVIIHIGNPDHSRKIITFTDLPCFLCANFYTGFTVYNDDRCICGCGCFFHFAHKIEKSRCVQKINFHISPFDRYDRCADRKSSFDLFFIIIADGIAISNFPHTIGNPCKIRHCFYHCSLSGTPMAQ